MAVLTSDAKQEGSARLGPMVAGTRVMVVPPASTDEALRLALAPYRYAEFLGAFKAPDNPIREEIYCRAARVLVFADAQRAFGGFVNPFDAAGVARRLARLQGTWCCGIGGAALPISLLNASRTISHL